MNAIAFPTQPLAALLALTSPLLASATQATTELEVQQVLELARAAIGWDTLEQRGGMIRVTGRAHMLGTDTEQVELFDAGGRFVQTFGGELANASGFDGTTAWNVDWNRTPRVLELGDRDSTLFISAVLSGFWTTGPAWLAFTGVEHEGEALRLDFAHAGGATVGSVLLDADSHLPTEISWRQGDADSRWTFGPFKEEDGFRFPVAIELVRGPIEQSFELDTLGWRELDDEAFAARLSPPDDAWFDSRERAELEVKRVPSGHLLVRPTLEGKDLGWFIFDTGAGTNCIDITTAKQLEGQPFGEIAAQGIGGTVKSSFRRAKDISLGPVTIDDVVFMELELGFLSEAFGVPIGGIVGYELISRCAVVYDQSKPSIALHEPATYELPEAGHWEPVLLVNRHPNVVATFEGREAVFTIDTGAGGDTVSLYHGAVEAGALLEGRKTRPGQAGGVGGLTAIRVGEVSSFVFGGVEVGPFDASFATEDKGAFANDRVWGHVGGRVLERFVLVFDYANRRLGFVPK